MENRASTDRDRGTPKRTSRKSGNNGADEAAIRRAIDEWIEAVRAKDIDAAMGHYADDLRSFNLALPMQQRGADEWRSSLQTWLGSWKGPVSIESSDVEVEVDGSVAYATSLNHVQGTRAEDDVRVDMWVRVTIGWRKRAGRWLAKHEHVSVPFHMDQGMRAALDARP